jgi:hypothetical protein|tara:strand:- start:860 stop:1051 length:192 start_codon:yes stop_codon:yes gene_type:complete
MTIEIWIRLEDLENLKTIQGRWFSTPELAVKYSTVPGEDSQHCVHITYDEFVRLLDNELLIKL